ncbi:hypothetical protein PIB30_001364 [Stylosanthes scabra]|uniref:F-box associated domain-containing protein n=1 Tax=Stylosanthes scabra TaxID=79078 RepID=A0ABU6Y2X5_9FABA|nr:hypothetical protein [Stylosanthes scabra]
MCEIFERCNGLTIQNVRRTCRHWSRILGSHNFVTRVCTRWSSRGCFLFAHFGYSFTWTTSLDWIMKLDSRTGKVTEFTLSFLINHDGWFEVVGVENGVFCVRYCCLGSERFLLIWNPATGMFSKVKDPFDLYNGEPSFLYAFVHYPDSLDYAIIHVFYEDYESPACTLAIYTTFRRNWDVTIPCPSYVHGLESTYVTLDEAVYWISDTVEGIAAHCHSILAKDGHIYVASNEHDEDTYHSVTWRLDQNGDDVQWVRLYKHHGNGTTYVPAVVADGAPIYIMEKHIDVEDLDELKFTNFDIYRYNEEDDTKTSLQMLKYDDDVDMRSLHLYQPSIYPV